MLSKEELELLLNLLDKWLRYCNKPDLDMGSDLFNKLVKMNLELRDKDVSRKP